MKEAGWALRASVDPLDDSPVPLIVLAVNLPPKTTYSVPPKGVAGVSVPQHCRQLSGGSSHGRLLARDGVCPARSIPRGCPFSSGSVLRR